MSEDHSLLIIIFTILDCSSACACILADVMQEDPFNQNFNGIILFSQLRYDGLDLVASSLARCVGLEDLPLAPCGRLLEIMKFGLAEEKAGILLHTNPY